MEINVIKYKQNGSKKKEKVENLQRIMKQLYCNGILKDWSEVSGI